jgi:hypothetical protein
MTPAIWLRPEVARRRRIYNMPAKTSTDNDIADEDIVPLADETASQAQRVVAAYAIDADECRMLLSMLGIEPTAKVE